MTAPATRTPVAATVAAVRTTLVTTSPEGCGRAGSAGWCCPAPALGAPAPARAPAPAAVRPGFAVAAGFALARGFEARCAFAAGLPSASALAAALLAAVDGLPPESRFSLRFPGRE